MGKKKRGLKLTTFKQLETPRERMKFLVKLADRGRWATKSQRELRRTVFDDIKDIKFPLAGRRCATCLDKAEVRHHIIPLSRNGSNIKRNICYLCKSCHSIVHPWLRTELLDDIAELDARLAYLINSC